MNRSNIEQALRFDPLDHAEKMTGKSYKEDEGTASLGFILAMDHAEHKDALLKSVGDSHFSMTAGEFIELTERLGFERILEESIEGTPDTFYVFWRSGILLRLESYWGDQVNKADIYFNFKGSRSALRGCSNGLAKEEADGVYIWEASADVREGFQTILERLESAGEILPQWVQRPFLWLLTYMDTKQPYDYQEINEVRIEKFSPSVQRAITPEKSR